MIYTRYGLPIRCTANLGQHQPKSFQSPATLVAVESTDPTDPYTGFQFAEFLKADGGWAEIKTQVEQARMKTLGKRALREAIRQAL